MAPELQLGQGGPASKAQVEESLREIFSDSAYRDVSPDSSVAEAKVVGVIERVAGWFKNLFDFMPNSSIDFWILLSLVLLAVVGFVVLGFRIYHKNRDYYLGDGPVLDLAGQGQRAELLERARVQAVADGALTEALSLRFRLGLVAVAQHTPGRLRPGFTNRECLVAFSEEPAYRDRLAGVIDLLDRKWYAQEECSQEEYSGAEAVLAEMGQHAL